jgi:hypothetical protein
MRALAESARLALHDARRTGLSLLRKVGPIERATRSPAAQTGRTPSAVLSADGVARVSVVEPAHDPPDVAAP